MNNQEFLEKVKNGAYSETVSDLDYRVDFSIPDEIHEIPPDNQVFHYGITN